MGDEKFLPSSYGLETTEATLAHYEAWAGTYDTEIGEENRYAQPERCTRALLASVLQRVEGKKCRSRHVVSGGIDPENAAFFS